MLVFMLFGACVWGGGGGVLECIFIGRNNQNYIGTKKGQYFILQYAYSYG